MQLMYKSNFTFYKKFLLYILYGTQEDFDYTICS